MICVSFNRISFLNLQARERYPRHVEVIDTSLFQYMLILHCHLFMSIFPTPATQQLPRESKPLRDARWSTRRDQYLDISSVFFAIYRSTLSTGLQGLGRLDVPKGTRASMEGVPTSSSLI